MTTPPSQPGPRPAPARPRTITAPRGPERIIDESCACIRCSYQLRGLKSSGVCPECGTAVAISLRGDVLRWADEGYLRALARGLAFILTGLALYALFLVGMMVAATGVLPIDDWEWWPPARDAAFLVSSGLALAGYWMFSAQDPGTSETEQPHSARRIIRVAAIADAGVKVVDLVLLIVGVAAPSPAAAVSGTGPAGLTGGEWAGLMVDLAGLVAFAALIFGTVLHTRWLARRVPDPALSGKTRTMLWLLPTVYILGAPLCCAGPAVALILYAGMLSDLRTDVMDILDWRERGGAYRS